MKKLMAIVMVVVLFSSCKKSLEEKARDIVLDAMTNGQWKITSFKVDALDKTAEFSPYKFQYHKNETVDAIREEAVESTGTWKGSAETMSISAQFTNVNEPLVMINGTWTITKNSWTFVEAKQITGNSTKTLRLDKL